MGLMSTKKAMERKQLQAKISWRTTDDRQKEEEQDHVSTAQTTLRLSGHSRTTSIRRIPTVGCNPMIQK